MTECGERTGSKAVGRGRRARTEVGVFRGGRLVSAFRPNALRRYYPRARERAVLLLEASSAAREYAVASANNSRVRIANRRTLLFAGPRDLSTDKKASRRQISYRAPTGILTLRARNSRFAAARDPSSSESGKLRDIFLISKLARTGTRHPARSFTLR